MRNKKTAAGTADSGCTKRSTCGIQYNTMAMISAAWQSVSRLKLKFEVEQLLFALSLEKKLRGLLVQKTLNVKPREDLRYKPTVVLRNDLTIFIANRITGKKNSLHEQEKSKQSENWG